MPIAISALPFRAAVTETTSSGRDVPSESITMPMIQSLTPTALARYDALSIVYSAPTTTKTSPNIANRATFVAENSDSSSSSKATISLFSLSKNSTYANINNNNKMPSNLLSTPSMTIKINKSTGKSAQLLSLAKKSRSGFTLLATKNTKASTSDILKILLPMTLATAISGLPWRFAVIEAAISGKDVPSATRVAPITYSEIPNLLAMRPLWVISRSEPHIKAESETIKIAS